MDSCSYTESDKIVSLDELDRLCQKARTQNKRIIFTNGCFDLLHVGHLRSLSQAKKLGDLLIVGINNDQSVRSLKGPKRPIFPERERAELIAGFGCVDYVTIFAGQRVTELLLRLKPHVHAKGTDYTSENVPEREAVRSYGGEIAITGDPKNHSSSDILDALSEQDAE
ncbi:adenylyltransferase/cytidyltransferase family protein [bacterium]|nr:adenylyltransferase/cytidyltransferase family protein [bacterium]